MSDECDRSIAQRHSEILGQKPRISSAERRAVAAEVQAKTQ